MEFLLGPQSPIPETVASLTPVLAERSLGWDGLRPFMDLRQELFEIDLRFSQLGSKGVFNSLDRAGILSHHFPGVDNIEHAVAHPPARGRARLRGEIVGRLAGSARGGRCSWGKIWDYTEGQVLDLSDPFASEERWQKQSRGEALVGALHDLF